MTDMAMILLDRFTRTKENFFMHIAYEEPHVPLFAAPEFINSSRRGPYGDAVQQMDHSIGKILDKLRISGLSTNTLVVFVSDNGGWLNPSSGLPGSPVDPLSGGINAPFQDGKGSTWEGGVRVPAIAWWPTKINASVSMAVATMMDFFPTFADLAGIQLNLTIIDGKSLVPLLLNQNTTTPHSAIYYWRESYLMAIRLGSWKAHWITRSGFDTDAPVTHDPPLLFNVEFDPAERVPFNITLYPQLYDDFMTAYKEHLQNIDPGVSQYEELDWSLIPCCHGSFDLNQWEEYIKEHEWSLALWELFGCVCKNSTSNIYQKQVHTIPKGIILV